MTHVILLSKVVVLFAALLSNISRLLNPKAEKLAYCVKRFRICLQFVSFFRI